MSEFRVFLHEHLDGPSYVIREVSGGKVGPVIATVRPGPDAMRIAHQFAASGDFLHALRDLLDVADLHFDSEPSERARAAIAKGTAP